VTFPMDVLDECASDDTEIGNLGTGPNTVAYCNSVFGPAWGTLKSTMRGTKTVADAVEKARGMQGSFVNVPRNERGY